MSAPFLLLLVRADWTTTISHLTSSTSVSSISTFHVTNNGHVVTYVMQANWLPCQPIIPLIAISLHRVESSYNMCPHPLLALASISRRNTLEERGILYLKEYIC